MDGYRCFKKSEDARFKTSTVNSFVVIPWKMLRDFPKRLYRDISTIIWEKRKQITSVVCRLTFVFTRTVSF